MERSDDDENFTLKAHPGGNFSEEYPEFVELDPTGRYGRYNKVLGKGAYKTVYKAFDELDGIEVAWNQVNIQETLHNSGNMERLYSELHLLKMLKHQNIIKFCNSWVDTRCKNVNFITEVFTSGTLRQYRKKHKHVKLKAIKHWSRQILQGLVYLHSHDPPIIHRDLKCDNIFINGNSGEVKIGDLGLAVILSQAPAAHSVIGTPEFMAPELYEEHYNQLVDIYSFGMCLLEIISFEYPYSECTNAAQIYKKVISGKRPEALKKVKDPEIRKFVEKCLASASERLTATELLMDPFLQIEEDQEIVECCQSVTLDPYDDLKDLCPAIKEPPAWADTGKAHKVKEEKVLREGNTSKPVSISSENHFLESPREKMGWKKNRDFRIKLKQQDETKVLIRFRITSATGGVRFIQFDFDIETDTAMSVACEMVTELDLSDQDPNIIAGMIDAELMTLFPDWMPGGWLDEAGGDEKQQEPVLESSEIEEFRADDVDGSSVPAEGLEVAPDYRNEVLVYGRFEEVGCNLAGSLRTQQEVEGLGSFSDFSSEYFEGGGSDLSLDAGFDRLNAETSVRDRLTRKSLEVDNADMRTEPLKGSEDSTKEVFTLPTSDHNLDGDVGPEELLVLVLQQKQEIELLQSKHNQELVDLKTHLEAEPNTSINRHLSQKRSSTQAINDSVESSARDLGESLQRIINEVSPNTFKETMLQSDINMDKLDNHGSFTPEVVLEKFDSRTVDTHMQPESSCTQLEANSEFQMTSSKDHAASEGCEDAKEPVHAPILRNGKIIMAEKSCLTTKEFGKLEGLVSTRCEMSISGVSMSLESTSKSEALHEPESTTEPESKSLSRPEGVLKERDWALSTKRESYLEFYKAGSNQKDKILATNDGVSKSSDSKDDVLDQVRKQLLQKSIAELEAKTLEGLLQSSSSYLVKKC